MVTFRGRYIIERSTPNTFSEPSLDLQATNRGQKYAVRLEVATIEDERLLLMTVLCDVKPSAKNMAALEAMFGGQMQVLRDTPTGNGADVFGRVVHPLEDLAPTHLREFCSNSVRGIREVAQNTVATIRWRYNVHWPLDWSSRHRLDYSLDGANFFSPPMIVKLYASSYTVSIRICPEVQDELQRAIADTSSWLPHQFLWEAKEHLSGRPRSALTLSMAAVEIGFKQLVARLVPDAGWLVEHMPSPPLAEMLRSYFPTLPGVIAARNLKSPRMQSRKYERRYLLETA